MLLIKNGRVLDPATKTDAALDVLAGRREHRGGCRAGKNCRRERDAGDFRRERIDCRARIHRYARAPARTGAGNFGNASKRARVRRRAADSRRSAACQIRSR